MLNLIIFNVLICIFSILIYALGCYLILARIERWPVEKRRSIILPELDNPKKMGMRAYTQTLLIGFVIIPGFAVKDLIEAVRKPVEK